ncbi:hypothetical protein [Parafilimonas terrae]|uniref:Uncharacterized protein n=1 Tax=Parafilimonas terrae TaxID=1465490 RepID=A0A1I5YG69_9BACT|nr:hypothetical protein [Parafilimonas terrae]SFQ43231.1 hypothetical protein SAMN05444277_11215 [Parafilimonas terrae]
MEQILDTILLEYDKSTFIIDLRKHSIGPLYITVEQIIHFDNNLNLSQKLKINPSILDDIIDVLINLKGKLSAGNKKVPSQRYFSSEKKEEVKKRYFKGISIKDLSLQFGCTENIIELILRNGGIEIVSNEVPKNIGRYKRRRRK